MTLEAIGGAVNERHSLTVFMKNPPAHIGEWVTDYIERFYDRYGKNPDNGVYSAQFPVEVRPVFFLVRRKQYGK